MAKGENKLPTPPAGEMAIPTWKDELYFEYHRGVFTTQADHKRNMRESEEWLLNTEKYSSLAWLQGQRLSRRQAHRRVETGALQPVPRPRRRLRHRHHL